VIFDFAHDQEAFREALDGELSTLENRLDQVLELDLATALATIPQDWQSDLQHRVETLYQPGVDYSTVPQAFADIMNRSVHCVVVSPQGSTSVVPLPPFTLSDDDFDADDDTRWAAVVG
jgi:hypothetical protein